MSVTDPLVPEPTAQGEKEVSRCVLGEYLARPFLARIPAYVHPNTISLTNHICNWILFILAFSAYELPQPYTAIAFIICSVINYACIILDCLDGMHARATNQCSKFGELLDHYLDALHVTMVGGAIVYALRLSPIQAASVQVMNGCVYASQLIHFHHRGSFVQTGGVEGQLMTSIYYLIAAGLSFFPVETWWIQHFNSITCIATYLICAKFSFDFMRQYDSVMLGKFLLNAVLNTALAAVFVHGGISQIAFTLLHSVFSVHVCGHYVLYSLVSMSFAGFHPSMFVSVLVLAYVSFVIPSTPLLHIVNPFVPSSSLVLQEASWHHFQTLRQVIPYLIVIDQARRSLTAVSTHFDRLVHRKESS